MDLGTRSLFLGLGLGLGLVACSGATAPVSSEPGGTPAPTAPPATPPPPEDPGAPTTTPPPPGNPNWSAQACPAATAKIGFAIGDSLGSLDVQDCDTGAPATLDEVCGAGATWICSAHTHCPTCQATAGFTDEVAAAVAAKNVAVVQIVYDDNGTTCEKWRTVYKLGGFSNVRVYADPGGAVFDKLRSSNYTAASAFLDKNRVITHLEHNLNKGEVLSEIDKALAVP